MVKSYKRLRPTIGVLANMVTQTRATHTFYGSLLRGIQAAVNQHNCNLLVTSSILYSMTHDGRTMPDRLPWTESSHDTDFVPVGPWNTDGLIITTPILSVARSEYIQHLRSQGYPVVYIGNGEEGASVCIDNDVVMRQALSHLVDHGHRGIAFLYAIERTPGDGTPRLHAYNQFMKEYGLEVDPRLVAAGNHCFDHGVVGMQTILASGAKFTAVLASNDESACGAISVLRQAGLRVPQDVAVIGIDDRLEAATAQPPLTSVRYPLFDTGFQAVELLLSDIDGQDNTSRRIYIPTSLTIRESCGCTEVMKESDRNVALASLDPVELGRKLHDSVQINIHQVRMHDVTTLSLELAQAFVTYANHEPEHLLNVLRTSLARLQPVDDMRYVLLEMLEYLQQLNVTLSFSERERLNSVLAQAFTMVNAETLSQHQRYLNQEAIVNQELSKATIRLHAAMDEEQVFAILHETLPTIGMKRVHIAFLEAEDDDAVAWSLLQTDHDCLQAERYFPTREFPPYGLYQLDETFTLLIFPLIVQGEQIGYVALDVKHISLAPQIVLELAIALKTARLYKQAAEGRRLAEEANRLKTRFLSTVSHELRTPLSQIVGLSELVLKQDHNLHDLPPVYRQDIERIYANAQHLKHLIGDVLDLSSGEVGKLRLHRSELTVPDMLAQVVRIGEHMALSKGLSWSISIADDLPLLWGDRARLHQVFLNLVTNAVKFTREGQVALTATLEQGNICVQVNDTGIGISAKEQIYIFDAFRQGVTQHHGGLGLGLAICKQLVTLHGGEISVSSSGEDGKGSVFSVRLPCLTQQIMDDRQEEKQLLANSPEKILVLTRNASYLTLLCQQLKEQGYEVDVREVTQYDATLKHFLSEPAYKAVLLDQSLMQEHSSPLMQNMPILFHIESNERISMLDVDYLTKPFSMSEMERVLARQGLLHEGQGAEKIVLIVDDEPGILDMHVRMIRTQSEHIHILTATNGREALAILNHTTVDLILLDLMMPELDGFGVLEALRDQPQTRDIPVIVLTAQTLTETEITRLNRGVHTILQKGLFTLDETLAHIDKALTRVQKLGNETQRLVRSAMAYIHTHYGEPIAREDIASHVHVSEDYLTRCFQQEVNVSPITYLNRYRINKAKELLAQGRLSIGEIALQVGFSDSNHFGRAFRREVGVSPSMYQRQLLSV